MAKIVRKSFLFFILGVLFFPFSSTVSADIIVVPPTPEISTFQVLPTKTVNEPYSQILQASGGIQPYIWSISAGSLPSGLSISASTGEISGTPTVTGNFSFTVAVTDTNSTTGTKNFNLAIAPQSTTGFVTIRTPSGSTVITPVTVHVQGVFGVDFCTDPHISSYRIQYNGFAGNPPNFVSPHQIHIQGDVVDDFVVMNLIPGTYPSAVLFCDTGNGILSYPIDGSLTVVPVQIETPILPDGFVDVFYSEIILVEGGTTPFMWNITNGSLPSDLSLNSTTGEISGTPTTVQTSNFTIQVTDANNQTDSKNLSITVHGNTPVGPNVQVTSGSTTLTFSNVTQEGQTTVTTSSGGQPPPTGFKLGNPPTYYSISTTATFNPPVEVCISWTEGQFNNENNLKLWHFDGVVWTDLTTSLDTVNNIICGLTNSFSDFAIFEKKQVVAQIDIKPNAYPNSINLGSNGNVSVAILSTPNFDATTIDPLSVELASAPVELRGNGTPQYSLQDVNNDGLLDMIVHVSTEALQLTETDEVANLIGYTLDDTEVLGSDTVRVVP